MPNVTRFLLLSYLLREARKSQDSTNMRTTQPRINGAGPQQSPSNLG